MNGLNRYSVYAPSINPRTFDFSNILGPQAQPSHDQNIFTGYDNELSIPDLENTEPDVSRMDRFQGLLADFMPGLGDLKGIQEGITGVDPATGENIPNWARPLGALPFVGALRDIGKTDRGPMSEIIRLAKELLEQKPNAKPGLLKQVLPNYLVNFAQKNNIDLQQVLSSKIKDKDLEAYNIAVGKWDSDMQNPLLSSQDAIFLNANPDYLPDNESNLLGDLNSRTHEFKYKLKGFDNNRTNFEIDAEEDDWFDDIYEVFLNYADEVTGGHMDEFLKKIIIDEPNSNLSEDFVSYLDNRGLNMEDANDELISRYLEYLQDDFQEAGYEPHHLLAKTIDNYRDQDITFLDYGSRYELANRELNFVDETLPTQQNLAWARVNDRSKANIPEHKDNFYFVNELQSDLQHFKPTNPLANATVKEELKAADYIINNFESMSIKLQDLLNIRSNGKYGRLLNQLAPHNKKNIVIDLIREIGQGHGQNSYDPSELKEMISTITKELQPFLSNPNPVDLRKTTSETGKLAKDSYPLLLENILGQARKDNVSDVFLNSPEGVLFQGGYPGASTMRDVYDKLPKQMGFEQTTDYPFANKFNISEGLGKKARILEYKHPDIAEAYRKFSSGQGSDAIIEELQMKGYDINRIYDEDIGGRTVNLEDIINNIFEEEYPNGIPMWKMNLSDTLGK